MWRRRCKFAEAHALICYVAFRDSPVVQGNSILALSALAAALAKYERNLPAENDAGLRVRRRASFFPRRQFVSKRFWKVGFFFFFCFQAGPEMVPTSSWLAMVLDTLLSIVSSGYKAKGQVFPWYLHVSGNPVPPNTSTRTL